MEPYTVVVAPDSFKGSLSATLVAQAIQQGWQDVAPTDRVRIYPMADGGEGTLEALECAADNAVRMPVEVCGPVQETVRTSWLLLPGDDSFPNGTGVVELASCSGIELMGSRRMPNQAHTVGFGEAICAALDYGVDKLILAVGSSASTDGGAGLLRALGAKLLDATGAPIADGFMGFENLASVDFSELRQMPPYGAVVLTDVNVPLVGPTGAAMQFGEQKGFSREQLPDVEATMISYADLVESAIGRSIRMVSRTGAAGGAGFGLLAWGAELVDGASTVAELISLNEVLADADVVITGEGSFDTQTAHGKVSAYIASRARAIDVDSSLVAGKIHPEADVSEFASVVSLEELAGGWQVPFKEPARWLRIAGSRLAKHYTS